MYQNLISKTICFFMITLMLLTIYSCGNSSSTKTISEAEKFVSSLDSKKLTPGVEMDQIFNYLFDKGITGSFRMKRGEGNIRLNTYTFPDNSTIIVVSKPKGERQGLEFIELKIKK